MSRPEHQVGEFVKLYGHFNASFFGGFRDHAKKPKKKSKPNPDYTRPTTNQQHAARHDTGNNSAGNNKPTTNQQQTNNKPTTNQQQTNNTRRDTTPATTAPA